MSKKRKTRKQKERAQLKSISIAIEEAQKNQLYSISKTKKAFSTHSLTVKPSNQNDFSYLKKDIVSIASASGIIIAFNILLAVLLFTSTIKLNFLGY